MNRFHYLRGTKSNRAIAHLALPHRSAIAIVAVWAHTLFGTCNGIQAATNNNWNLSSGGSWNVGANWSTGSIPTVAENANLGPIATSVTSPVSITLDTNQTAYALTLDPGPGKSIHLDRAAIRRGALTLLSTDTAPDGINKFFTINVPSGVENQINAPVVLGGVGKGSFTATINSFDPAFAVRGGVSESVSSWGVWITGNNQGIVSYAVNPGIYTGDTTIAAGGILRVDLNNAIPSGALRGNVVLEGNGQLQFLNATVQGINGLNSTSSTAVLTNLPGNNGVTLTVGNANASGNFAGSINNPTSTGVFNLVKTGSGIQKFTGANSYRGNTSVSAGTLLVNGTHNGAGSYSIGAGATLGGTGTINLNLLPDRAVTVNNGSLAPGDGGPGVLNINGPLNISGPGTLRVELGGAFPGNGSIFYDQVTMTNPKASINASFAQISATLVNGFKPTFTDVFYILTRADSGAFSASPPFAAYPEGAFISIGSGFTGKVTYKANWTGNQSTSTITGGNDMAIFIVPEPNCIPLVIISLVSFALIQTTRNTTSRRTLSE
jgi:autotransporter-associated beta strand protein